MMSSAAITHFPSLSNQKLGLRATDQFSSNTPRSRSTLSVLSVSIPARYQGAPATPNSVDV